MATPIKKEFGPGYDYPNRMFNLWAVILPTVLVAAFAVVLMRHAGGAGNRVSRSPVVTCPTQTCRPADATDSATPTQSARQVSGSSATPIQSVTRAMLSQASPAVTHAVVLSSA